MITWNGSPELLERPVTLRMPRDVALQDKARRMLNHDEYADYIEGRRNHRREVAGHDHFGVISCEPYPALVGSPLPRFIA